MSTINDVSRLAKVSKSTVSYVLSGKKNVGEEIRARVLDACAKLDYKPNFFAANVLSNKSGIIGLFFEPENNNWYSFYNKLIEICVVELEKRGMRLIPYFNIGRKAVIELLKSGRAPIMGAIIVTPQILDERIELFEKDHLPFVLIGEPEKTIESLKNVDINSTELTREIFEFLYNKGHRNILFMNAYSRLTIAGYREKALRKFVDDHPGFKVKTVNIADEPGCARKAFSAEYENDFSCIVTASDIMARDIYELCAEKNLVIGRDLSIAAFGGDECACFSPSLTVARQDYTELGAAAVKMLCRILDSETPLAAETVLIRSNIEYGDSIADLSHRTISE